MVLSGSIGGTVYSYLGEVGDSLTRLIKISKTPTDPLSQNRYAYGVTSNQKDYQIAGSFENTAYAYHPGGYTPVNTTFADGGYSARVRGSYRGYLKFSSGSQIYLANIPSIIFSSTG